MTRRAASLLGLLLLLLLLVGALAAKGWLSEPPALEAAGPGQFDAVRAKARLARILGDQRPHPVDTAADDAVRDRLIAELRAIGLAARVTDDWACGGGGKAGRFAACARVRNVVATIGDPAAAPAVLLASHYDSTPAGPGAADDGIGVATMLEIASLVKDRKLERPVVLLFDEGEEAGLLGARAFLAHDPLAGRIASLVNFEARGVTGPATMFETSRPNGGAIAAFKASGARPVASSMTADFYRLIPNSTDVTVFAAARPWTILNFAVIGNESRYHSPGDTVDALDPASLQHMGRQGLAATLRLASGAPTGRGDGERLYADLAGRVLIVLPREAALATFGLLLIGTIAFAFARRDELLRGAGAVLAAIVGSAALVYTLQWLVGLARPGLFWRAHPELMALAVDLVALAASAGALAWIAADVTRKRLRAAFWLVFMLLTLGIVAAAPGAAIFALVPPLLMLIGWLAGQRARRAETVAAILAWGVLFLTWAPLLALSEVLLDFPAAWLFGPVAALLVLPALIEMKPLTDGWGGRLALGGTALAAAAAWAALLVLPAYSLDRKQGFRIEYAWDAEAGKGQWLVANGGAPLPGGFPGRAAFQPGAKLPWTASSRWAAPAPALPLPAPRLEPGGSSSQGGTRVTAVRVAANGADDILFRLPPGAALKAVRTRGAETAFTEGGAGDPYTIRCTGRSCDGAVIEFVLGPAPVEATLVGIRNTLPAAAAPMVRARPATAQAQYSPDSSMSWTKVQL
jgi:hypothetical protein